MVKSNEILVAPSLLAANFLELKSEIEMINSSEADWLHLDIMDGHFVPNISFGPFIVSQVRKISLKPLDVHLMIEEPEKFTDDFFKAGANRLSVHIEVCRCLHRNIEQIKSLGMKAGVAINPHSPIDSLAEIIRDIDQVCLMSVDPGFGGQVFIPHSLEKITALKKLILNTGSKCLIEIDGGVTQENSQQIIDAGADILVAGSSVFHAKDPIQTIHFLKSLHAKTSR